MKNKYIAIKVGYLIINLQIYWRNKINLLSSLVELEWVTDNQVLPKQWHTRSKSAETVLIWERMALKLEHYISPESVYLLACCFKSMVCLITSDKLLKLPPPCQIWTAGGFR